MSDPSTEEPKTLRAAKGLGYKPDEHDKSADPKARAMLGAISAPAMPDASVEEFVEQILDQETTQACTGFAFSLAGKVRCGASGHRIAQPSPVAPYTFGRAIERGLVEAAPLTDEGAQPRLVMQGLEQWGMPLNTEWPFDPKTIDDEPSFEELEFASSALVTAWGRIDEEQLARVARTCQAIQSLYPVVIGTQVDRPMEDATSTSIVQPPRPELLLGGHMMLIVGFRTVQDKAGNKRVQFRVANSWGLTYADAGYFWADQDWLMSDYATDLYIANTTPHLAAA